MLRETSWLFFEILLPFLATSAFVFVYRALQAPPRVHRVRRPRRGDDRVLAERRLDDGRASCTGRRARATSSSTSPPRWTSWRSCSGWPSAGMVMSSTRAVVVLRRRRRSSTASRSTVDQWLLLVVVFLLTLTALYGLGHDPRQPVPGLGPRGLPAHPAVRRAGLLRLRPQLPGRQPRPPRGAGARDDPAGGRPRRDAPARLRRLAAPRSARRRRRSRR